MSGVVFSNLLPGKGPADVDVIPVEMELMMACDKINLTDFILRLVDGWMSDDVRYFVRSTSSNWAGLTCRRSGFLRVKRPLRGKGFLPDRQEKSAFKCLFITRSSSVKPVDIFCYFVSKSISVGTL